MQFMRVLGIVEHRHCLLSKHQKLHRMLSLARCNGHYGCRGSGGYDGYSSYGGSPAFDRLANH